MSFMILGILVLNISGFILFFHVIVNLLSSAKNRTIIPIAIGRASQQKLINVTLVCFKIRTYTNLTCS